MTHAASMHLPQGLASAVPLPATLQFWACIGLVSPSLSGFYANVRLSARLPLAVLLKVTNS